MGFFDREGNIAGFKEWMQVALSIDGATLHHEQATCVEIAGYEKHVYICYWTNPYG